MSDTTILFGFSAEPATRSPAGSRDYKCLWPDSSPPGCVSLVRQANRIPVDFAHLHPISPPILDG